MNERRIDTRFRPILRAEQSKRIVLTLIISFQFAICVMPSALAQRNAINQSLAKLGSASKGLVEVGNALPVNIIVVTNTNDSGPGSLRDALSIANDGDTIDATVVSGAILLTSGELQITHNVIINGPGSANLAINGNATSRVFENFASNVTISGFTITNGLPADNNEGGGILNGASNARIATLTITNSTVSGNSAEYGGGICNTTVDGGAVLTVINCTISGNSASYGGGIFSSALGSSGGGSTVTVSNTTLNDNSAAIDGGGIYNRSGGFSHEPASLTLNNSSVSGNSATGNGGGICNNGELGPGWLAVSNSTVSGNSATGNGGGIYNDGEIAELELGGTILNVGSSGENILNNGGSVTSLGYNVSSDNGGGFLTGPGDQTNTDPMLGPLQDNGGPTFTHALLPGSPAIDAGNPNFTPPPFYDQRGPGFDRVVNGRIDIGSFEVQSTTPTPTPTPTATVPPRATPTPRPLPTPTRRP